MPAVNPARLKSEIKELAGVLDDPSSFSRQVLSLLRFYADYTRRPGSATGVDDAPWVLHVPGAVQREVQRALVRWLQDPDKAQDHCSALWETGYREMQLIAAVLLGQQAEEWVPFWAAERARDSRDRQALAALASSGLAGWRAASMQDYLKTAGTWLGDSSARMQAFALLALREVPAETGDWLPEIFDILEHYHWQARGETRKALLSLVEALAAASDRETAGFLLQMLSEQPEKAAPFLPNLQAFFSERQVRLFRLADSSSGEDS